MVFEIRQYRDVVTLGMYASINDRMIQVKKQSRCPKHRYVVTSTLSGVLGHVSFQCTHCAKIVHASRSALESNIYIGRAYQRRLRYERQRSTSIKRAIRNVTSPNLARVVYGR